METREEIKRIICSSAGQVNKDSTLPALLGLGPAPSILVPQVRLVLARSPVPAPTNATTRRSLRNHKRRTQPHRRRRERLNLGRSRTWSRPCRWSQSSSGRPRRRSWPSYGCSSASCCRAAVTTTAARSRSPRRTRRHRRARRRPKRKGNAASSLRVWPRAGLAWSPGRRRPRFPRLQARGLCLDGLVMVVQQVQWSVDTGSGLLWEGDGRQLRSLPIWGERRAGEKWPTPTSSRCRSFQHPGGFSLCKNIYSKLRQQYISTYKLSISAIHYHI